MCKCVNDSELMDPTNATFSENNKNYCKDLIKRTFI
jgi:hypothetical protein